MSPLAPSDVAAQRLGHALLSLSSDICQAAHASQPIRNHNEGMLDAAKKLDAWLWLWESHGGAHVLEVYGDEWLMPQLSRLSFNYAANRLPRFHLRLPGNEVDPVSAIDERLTQEGKEALVAVVDRYVSLLPKGTPPLTEFEIFHLPMLVLLSHRVGVRAPEKGVFLDGYVGREPLGLMVENQDLALTSWWLNDFSFTADNLESYTIGHRGEPLLHNTLVDVEWTKLWLSKGVSPLGNPGTPVGETPLFQTFSASVVEALIDAGADPDTCDEQGALVDEYRDGPGRKLDVIHTVCQEARRAMGRPASVEKADWRYQFTLLGQAKEISHPGFSRALNRGPWPTLETSHGSIGILEYLARTKTEASLNQLRTLGKKWTRKSDQLRRVHHDGLPDWAIAHAISAGALETPKTPSSPFLASALMPAELKSDDMENLIRAWAKYGKGNTQLAMDAWNLKLGSNALKNLAPEHIPAILELNEMCVEDCIEEGRLATSRLALMLELAGALWQHASTPADRKELWSIVMWAPVQTDSTTPSKSALEAATPELWNHLSQTPLWQKFGAEALPQYVPHIRSARHQELPPEIGPRRPRARP